MFNHVEADREEPCQGLLEQGRPEKTQNVNLQDASRHESSAQVPVRRRLSQVRRKQMEERRIIGKIGHQSTPTSWKREQHSLGASKKNMTEPMADGWQVGGLAGKAE